MKGILFTLGPNQRQTVWPMARVTLKNLATGSEISVVSNQLGEFLFTGRLPGEYEIRATLAGFETAARRFTLKPDEPAQLDFQLTPSGSTKSIEVTSETKGVDVTSSSGGAPALNAKILKSAVQLSDDFQEALPLLPGVVRGRDGLMRIKGGRTNQSSALVNTASVADPFTGQPALRLPAVAVESVRVLSNPFSAEYGQFASGVVETETRGGTDKWRWLFEDPIPRFRWINGRIHGVESASPHLVFAGPIRRGKLYMFQSTSYNYDTTRVPSLPDPDNVRVDETVNSYSQYDWDITPSQRFTAILTLDPQNIRFANIDTFNPQAVTASYRQRGFFSSASHRLILPGGGFVQSLFSAKRLDPRVFPAGPGAEMTLYPEKNSGAFFQGQDRRTRLYQWSQRLHLPPLQSGGRHLLTLGYSYSHASYRGQTANLPVTVLREDGTLSRRITYDDSIPSNAAKHELAVFLQDNWQIHPRLALDLGLRCDSDNLSGDSVSLAPRAGFVFAATRDNRTAIRGGFGVFYDKIPLNVSLFGRFPAQTITRYASDGVSVLHGPQYYAHVVATPDGEIRTPYSLGWSIQIDRELHAGLLLRLGYEERKVYRDFYIDPYESAGASAELRLYNSGRQSYRELLWMLRWQPTDRTTVFLSYVRSKARGELNDYNQFFGNFPSPLVRPNQRGPLAHDAPNRVLFWSIIGLPKQLEFIPILDLHSGFPHSRLDQDWNFIGRRNEAGRFPVFVGLDTKVQYPFDFKFRRWRIQFQAGLRVFNLLNHFNPRDVQQYSGSPNYGTFYNSVGRLFRIEGNFDF